MAKGTDKAPESAAETTRRVAELYDLAPNPPDLFSDFLIIHGERDVVRLEFRCSRIGSEDFYGSPTIPVARLTMPRAYFDGIVKDWNAQPADD